MVVSICTEIVGKFPCFVSSLFSPRYENVIPKQGDLIIFIQLIGFAPSFGCCVINNLSFIIVVMMRFLLMS